MVNKSFLLINIVCYCILSINMIRGYSMKNKRKVILKFVLLIFVVFILKIGIDYITNIRSTSMVERYLNNKYGL